MEFKIGAVIVTYNPNLRLLKKNIEAIEVQVKKVVIVDNGSENSSEIKLLFSSKVQFIELEDNKGIAFAQNVGMRVFLNESFDWVVTLDQDTVLPTEAVKLFTESKKIRIADTGILAAQYIDRNWNSAQRAEHINSGTQVIEKHFVIASGNMVRVEAWDAVGGFDNNLFIDYVDDDFNAKIRLMGYKIWELSNVRMEHAIGRVVNKPLLARMLLYPKNAVFYDHTPFREFYIHRNRIIMIKRYPESFNKKNMPLLLNCILHLRPILICSGPKLKKFMAALSGIRSGLAYKTRNDEDFQTFERKVKV